VPTIGGCVLDPPRALPEFELIDDQGRLFGRDDFEGAWSLLYFGYTYCPDVCPLALASDFGTIVRRFAAIRD
jgi:protein SCO1/2